MLNRRNGNEEVEPALPCLNFSNVDVEEANWVGPELLLGDFLAPDIR
jgi:hypothetical protein